MQDKSTQPLELSIITPQIEAMKSMHWDAVKYIYEQGIATGHATFQSAAPATWEMWDAAHLKESRWVATIVSTVIGWVALSPTSARECYRGVCELSVYEDPAHHGKGIGSLLMHTVIESSEAAGLRCLYSSTFPDNKASISLQKKFELREIGYQEMIAQQNGIWRDTVLLELRSKVVGCK